MITGIVEDVGCVQKRSESKGSVCLEISTELELSDCKVGDSIAINGVCLTFICIQNNTFQVQVVQETLSKTNIKNLSKGAKVNLERMASIGQRINGHIVQGHVDVCSEILAVRDYEGARWLDISLPEKFVKYVVDKGSICIDGMSITVVSVTDKFFTVTLIPHTLKSTIANNYQKGSVVNLEMDILAKHVEKLLENHYGK